MPDPQNARVSPCTVFQCITECLNSLIKRGNAPVMCPRDSLVVQGFSVQTSVSQFVVSRSSLDTNLPSVAISVSDMSINSIPIS